MRGRPIQRQPPPAPRLVQTSARGRGWEVTVEALAWDLVLEVLLALDARELDDMSELFWRRVLGGETLEFLLLRAPLRELRRVRGLLVTREASGGYLVSLRPYAELLCWELREICARELPSDVLRGQALEAFRLAGF